PAVPAELRAGLAKMTAKEPGQRYQTPAEVAAALAPFIKKATTAKPAAGAGGGRAATGGEAAAAAPGAEGERQRAWPVPVGVGAVAAVLLVVGALALIVGRSRPPTEVAPGTKEPAAPVAKQPEKLPATFTNKLGMEFVLVPRGKSWLGGGGGTMGNQE